MFALFFIACGKESERRGPSKHPRLFIVGGYDTERWEYTWQVLVKRVWRFNEWVINE